MGKNKRPNVTDQERFYLEYGREKICLSVTGVLAEVYLVAKIKKPDWDGFARIATIVRDQAESEWGDNTVVEFMDESVTVSNMGKMRQILFKLKNLELVCE